MQKYFSGNATMFIEIRSDSAPDSDRHLTVETWVDHDIEYPTCVHTEVMSQERAIALHKALEEHLKLQVKYFAPTGGC